MVQYNAVADWTQIIRSLRVVLNLDIVKIQQHSTASELQIGPVACCSCCMLYIYSAGLLIIMYPRDYVSLENVCSSAVAAH